MIRAAAGGLREAVHRPGRTDLRALVLRKLLGRLGCGTLTVVLPNGAHLVSRGSTAGPDGTLNLHRWRTLRRMLIGGDIGLAEAYMDGDWSSPDLTSLIELVARNRDSLASAGTTPMPTRLLQLLRHVGHRNSLGGSRRNIVQHYDLGNEFYACWLDRGMSYSAAPYRDPAICLEAAQGEKHEHILRLLDVRPGQRVLEIGCGWGGLAERLAAAGCQVTGITLSPAQLAYARTRVAAAGLADRVDLRLQDYREVDGQYDRIVSIEMLEAVGEAWWPTYFGILRARLDPGGIAVLQVITIDEAHFAEYRRSPDFIQHYIFPGGMLPPPGAIRAEAARCGLAVQGPETFGDGYARTLAAWQSRFQARWPEIAALGFPPRFKRMWEYYLSYCEAGFRAGAIDVGLWRLGQTG